MRPEPPKKIRQLLREHIRERNALWQHLLFRLEGLKRLAEKENHRLFLNFFETIEAHHTLELLYKALIWKRDHPEDKDSEVERPYTPCERPSSSMQERLLSGGLEKHLFNLN